MKNRIWKGSLPMAQGQNTIVSRGVYCMCSMYCMAQRILNWILESVKIWILGWAFHNTYSQSTKNLRWIYSVVLTKAKVVWATRGNSRPRRHNFVLFWLPSTCKWTLLTLIVDKNWHFLERPPTTSFCPHSQAISNKGVKVL